MITQNIDNLHELAESTEVVHLLGELYVARSTADENLHYQLEGKDIHLSDLGDLGSQLRPHIVCFEEDVSEIRCAEAIVKTADN